MSDSSLSVDSVCENNLDLGLDLINCFNKLKIESTSDNFSDCILNNNLNMTTPPVLDMKNLSVIPNFNGSPNKLNRFISVSESILNHYYDRQRPENFQNTLLINGILNKLEGRAEEVVAINGGNSWDDIKNTLLQNFGDQRDENCLNQDLVNLRQKLNETPYQYHERVLHLLNIICNYVDLHSDAAERQCKRKFFTKQALTTFLAGLKEPLGATIRAMRPTTLAEALQFISEEDNIKYLQKCNQPNIMGNKNPITQHPQNHFKPNQYSQNYFHPSFSQMNVQQRPMTFPQQQTFSQFPRGPVNIQRHPNPPPQRFPTNSQTFGRPQNVWRPTFNAPQNKPTPMSVSTRNTNPQFRRPYQNNAFQNNALQNNAFQNNGQRPNKISEQLFTTEHYDNQQIDETPEYSYDEEQTYEYSCPDEEQYENFQEDPSPTNET